jgi:hypothetical protein
LVLETAQVSVVIHDNFGLLKVQNTNDVDWNRQAANQLALVHVDVVGVYHLLHEK